MQLDEYTARYCLYCRRIAVGLFLTKPGSSRPYEPLCNEHSYYSWTAIGNPGNTPREAADRCR